MLDSVVEESLYMIGPVGVGGILAVSEPAWAWLLSAALIAIGSTLMVLPRQVTAMRVPDARNRPALRLGPIRDPRIAVLAVLVALTAIGLSSNSTVIAGQASHMGAPQLAGWIGGVMAFVSLLGGLLWTRRSQVARNLPSFIVLLAWLLLATAVTAFVPSPLNLIFVTVSSLAVAPWFTVSYMAADQVSTEVEKTEAMTWVNTSNNIGSAAGSTVGGTLIAGQSLTLAYGTNAAIIAIAIGVAIVIYFVRGRDWMGRS